MPTGRGGTGQPMGRDSKKSSCQQAADSPGTEVRCSLVTSVTAGAGSKGDLMISFWCCLRARRWKQTLSGRHMKKMLDTRGRSLDLRTCSASSISNLSVCVHG